MTYRISLTGDLLLDRPLDQAHGAYLRRFAVVRHVRRSEEALAGRSDPLRESAGLPVGVEGAYCVAGGDEGAADDTVISVNTPPSGQSSLYCHWAPSGDGARITWDGLSAFSGSAEWLAYLIEHFLQPWGYTLRGTVGWVDSESNRGLYLVADNALACWEAILRDPSLPIEAVVGRAFAELGTVVRVQRPEGAGQHGVVYAAIATANGQGVKAAVIEYREPYDLEGEDIQERVSELWERESEEGDEDPAAGSYPLLLQAWWEEEGPPHCRCPRSILARLSPTGDEDAQEWRRRCCRQAPPEPGDVVIFDAPVACGEDGGARRYFRKAEGDDQFIALENARPCRLTGWEHLGRLLRLRPDEGAAGASRAPVVCSPGPWQRVGAAAYGKPGAGGRGSIGPLIVPGPEEGAPPEAAERGLTPLEQAGNARLIVAATTVFFKLARYLDADAVTLAEVYASEENFIAALDVDGVNALEPPETGLGVPHTPGPWHVSSHASEVGEAVVGRGAERKAPVVLVPCSQVYAAERGLMPLEQAGNTRLIAAAANAFFALALWFEGVDPVTLAEHFAKGERVFAVIDADAVDPWQAVAR